MNFLSQQMGYLLIYTGNTTVSLLLKGCDPGSRKGDRIETGEVAFYTSFPATRAVIGKADTGSKLADF